MYELFVKKVESYKCLYQDTLINDILPFWVQHSVDRTNGGYYTSLDRYGKVYDTDKFMWLQARQVWTFSKFYNQIEQNPEWLEVAKLGANFILRHGLDRNYNLYFALTADGTPLIEPYNIFSDCFTTMAFNQFGIANKDQQFIDSARSIYKNILKRKGKPKGRFDKSTGNRRIKDFALPMILSNLVLEIEEILNSQEVEEIINLCGTQIMDQFVDPDSNLILENLSHDGKQMDTYEGRLINPGHGIEAMWFMLDIGQRNGDLNLINKCKDVILSILDFSWDRKYGGIFYFMDIKGYPPQQLEWDQKLWWVHLETLVALSKAFHLTKDRAIWQWFETVHEYTWDHFSDPEFGEWFGYLNREGKPHIELKGGKWKGCFHVPRAMFQCWKTLETIQKEKNFNSNTA